MLIDRIIFPIESLGPGNRIVIWTVGCSKKCKNCSNVELWKKDNSKDLSAKTILSLVRTICRNNMVDGITFTGGDPMEQKDDFLFLIREINKECKDILVYTGYLWEEIKELYSEDEVSDIKKYVGVLVDGPYIDELNHNDCTLRGSINQRVIIFEESLRNRYEAYLRLGRRIQNVYKNNEIVSVGIHNKEVKQ